MRKLTKTLLIVGGAVILSEVCDIFGEARALAVAKAWNEKLDMTPGETIDYLKDDDEIDYLDVNTYGKWKCRQVGKLAEVMHDVFFGEFE